MKTYGIIIQVFGSENKSKARASLMYILERYYKEKKKLLLYRVDTLSLTATFSGKMIKRIFKNSYMILFVVLFIPFTFCNSKFKILTFSNKIKNFKLEKAIAFVFLFFYSILFGHWLNESYFFIIYSPIF